jgi:hypothetical protein
MHLIGMHLINIQFIGMYLIGVHLMIVGFIDTYLIPCTGNTSCSLGGL